MKNSKKRKKVIVAMSGGVDSSVAAALLKKQGYFVIGVMLKFWSEDRQANSDGILQPISHRFQNDKENVCCDTEGLLGARAVARKLNIPFYVIDVSEEFKREVVDYYISEYELGRTPNPCVMCNRFIKFGRLLDIAKSLGAEYLATGHYARIKRNFQFSIFNFQTNSNDQNSKSKTQEIYQLLKAKDKIKDQSYFLWQLRQEQLKHILFPIGEHVKDEVRKIARDLGLPVAEKKDSQAVCFIPDRDNVSFLKKWAKKLQNPGPIVDIKGNKIGKHEGLCYYTIGQRHGLPPIFNFQFSIFNKKDIPPLYVIKLDIKNNALTVSEDKDLYGKELFAENINWISPVTDYPLPVTGSINCKAKIRYRQLEQKCELRTVRCDMEDKNIHVTDRMLHIAFNKPQRAITPGQSIVFYDKDEILGGGIIAS